MSRLSRLFALAAAAFFVMALTSCQGLVKGVSGLTVTLAVLGDIYERFAGDSNSHSRDRIRLRWMDRGLHRNRQHLLGCRHGLGHRHLQREPAEHQSHYLPGTGKPLIRQLFRSDARLLGS